MRWFGGAKNTKHITVALAVVIGVNLLANGTLALANTDVYTFVCNQATSLGSTVSIQVPQSDRTVTNSNIAISGKVDLASQIEVYVDDQYSSTIPLSLGQKTFTVNISLSVGTHSIKLTANPTCGTTAGTDEIVLTYVATPGGGSGNQPDSPGSPSKTPIGVTSGEQPDQAGQNLDLAGTPEIEIDKGPSTGLWPVDFIIEQSRGNPITFSAYSLAGVVGVFVIWRSINTLGITKGVLDSKYITRLFFRKKP